MKGGFSGDRRILGAHNGKCGSCVRSAPCKGVWGQMLDFRPSEIVSGAIWK